MTHRRRLMLLVVLAVLLMAGVADVLAFGGLPMPQPSAGHVWTLSQYVSNGTEVALPSSHSPTLYMQSLGHKLSGSAGCNSYFGSYYSLFPGRLSISGLGQTVMYCLPASIDEFEAHFMSDLPRVDSYRLDGSDLVLSGDGGRLSMRFTPSA